MTVLKWPDTRSFYIIRGHSLNWFQDEKQQIKVALQNKTPSSISLWIVGVNKYCYKDMQRV